MATDADLLKGEVVENPSSKGLDVEKLMMGFLSALMAEQGLNEARTEVAPLPAPPAQSVPTEAIANG